MAKKYLDYDGLSTLVSLSKSTFASNEDLNLVAETATNAASAATTNAQNISNLDSTKADKTYVQTVEETTNNVSTRVDDLNSTKADKDYVLTVEETANNASTRVEDLNTKLVSDFYNKTDIDNLLGSLEKITVKVVTSLDEVTEENIIYLVPKDNTGESNSYFEYMFISGSPEKIGDTEIDLSNYVTNDDIVFATNDEIDGLFTA